jgi:hypothetical protein
MGGPADQQPLLLSARAPAALGKARVVADRDGHLDACPPAEIDAALRTAAAKATLHGPPAAAHGLLER